MFGFAAVAGVIKDGGMGSHPLGEGVVDDWAALQWSRALVAACTVRRGAEEGRSTGRVE